MLSIAAATLLLLQTAAALHVGLPFQSTASHLRAPHITMDDIPQTKPNGGVTPVNRVKLTCSFEIPKKGIAEYGTAEMAFQPLLVESEVIVVRYALPFGLAAEPRGRVVAVTKDGPGGEKEGDLVRFCTKWTEREPSLFDVCKCMERQLQNSFDQVVAALVTNDGTYADEMVLVLERPL